MYGVIKVQALFSSLERSFRASNGVRGQISDRDSCAVFGANTSRYQRPHLSPARAPTSTMRTCVPLVLLAASASALRLNLGGVRRVIAAGLAPASLFGASVLPTLSGTTAPATVVQRVQVSLLAEMSVRRRRADPDGKWDRNWRGQKLLSPTIRPMRTPSLRTPWSSSPARSSRQDSPRRRTAFVCGSSEGPGRKETWKRS
eukprot:scaffold34_cov260-Pinguiococcus_pyrenoidosus.AAC.25